MGLGSFGGGVGLARYLAMQGATVTVTDLQPAEKLRDSLNPLAT
jgi:UDP-N-acetylmuramoylalanine--D-glutamate ligase